MHGLVRDICLCLQYLCNDAFGAADERLIDTASLVIARANSRQCRIPQFMVIANTTKFSDDDRDVHSRCPGDTARITGSVPLRIAD